MTQTLEKRVETVLELYNQIKKHNHLNGFNGDVTDFAVELIRDLWVQLQAQSGISAMLQKDELTKELKALLEENAHLNQMLSHFERCPDSGEPKRNIKDFLHGENKFESIL